MHTLVYSHCILHTAVTAVCRMQYEVEYLASPVLATSKLSTVAEPPEDLGLINSLEIKKYSS